MRSTIWLGLVLAFAGNANATEVTVKNDSLANNAGGAIILGFAAGEGAASWLTSPCDGNIVAAQVFWRSQFGGAPLVVEDSIDFYRSGTFPVPGALAQQILGPQLTDGVFNEYRYLDENNTIPFSVPVLQNETFVLAFTYAEGASDLSQPSLVVDQDGIQSGRNALYGDVGFGPEWRASNDPLVGIHGDWALRAVINCVTTSTDANVSTTVISSSTTYTPGAPLQYTVAVNNAGPISSTGTTVVDTFPSAYSGAVWTCAASSGASCTASGSGNIIDSANLPSGGQVVYTVNGTVIAGTTGTLSNSATAIVHAPTTDPNPTDNTGTLDLMPATSDVIFANGFESPTAAPPIVAARAMGMRPTR
ncbi:MAG: hypothetical protein ABIQ70_09260 [Dokdonella sp.]